MNTNPKFLGFFSMVVGGMLAGQAAFGDVVYNNSSNRSSPALFGQTSGYEMGDELRLSTSGTYVSITNFVFEYYLTGAVNSDEQIRLRLYWNDGAAYGTNEDSSTFYAPGTMVFDSGFFDISATTAGTLAFNGADLGSGSVVVPTNFTWTVEFGGIDVGESAGLTLFDPATVGYSFPDYWERATGDDWVLNTTNNTQTTPLNFGVFVEGEVATDIDPPKVSIVSPVNKFRSFDASLTVDGKANDKSGQKVAMVLWRVGSTLYGTNSFAPAAVTQSTATTWLWTNAIPLQPGLNYFQVKSVDTAGNQSALLTRLFTLVVESPFTLVTIGNGTVTPTLGSPLEVNTDYTVTATGPLDNTYWFSNWLASVDGGPTNEVSTINRFTFTMQTNYVLIAQFVTNRFIEAAGLYYGLFTDEDTPIVSFERSGLFTLKVDSKRKFSGKLYLDGNAIGYAGLLNLDGSGVSKKPSLRKGKSALVVNVQLALDGSDAVSGTVAALSNAPSPYVLYPTPFTSVMTGFKAGFNLTDKPATNYLGTYTMVADIPAGDPDVMPKGNGYGVIAMKTNGMVKSVGLMGDYAPFKPVVVPISKDGDWPLYAATYKGVMPYFDNKSMTWKTNKENNGMIMGWMKFTNHTDVPTGRDLLDGSVHWIKYPNPNFFYPNGFTNHDLDLLASVYVAPTNFKTQRMLDMTTAAIEFTDGDLIEPFTNLFTFETNNKLITIPPKVSNVNTQNMALTPKTGLVKGKFYHPADGFSKRVPAGAVLQDENIARGVFIGTNSSGSFLLRSND